MSFITNTSSETRSVVGSTSQDNSTAEQTTSSQRESLTNTMKKRSKARRLAEAKAELAQLKVEHAAARLALIELESSDEEVTNENQPPNNQIKLTPIVTELPRFDGNHRDWANFKSAYYQTANDLTAAENMSRLRKRVRGEAKKALRKLLSSTEDPEIIMETLELRFHRPDVIARQECQKILRLPVLTESTSEFITFATELETSVEILLSLNTNVYDLTVIRIRGLVEKLTPALKQKWTLFRVLEVTEEPALVKFSRFIKKEAENVEATQNPNKEEESYVKEDEEPYCDQEPFRKL